PDELAAELEGYIRAGWFRSEEDAIRSALKGLRYQVKLQERFIREDIEWGLSTDP
ncbi:MAG: CopG family transcriptional regulator, partial [Candidatus Rokuibacteriota bacterium]